MPKQPIAYATEASHADEKPIAYFTITKVVRENVPILGGGTSSYGELLDSHLVDQAANGHTVQTVEIDIPEETWNRFCQSIRQWKGITSHVPA